ncbi:hypothetical protein [Haloferula chungangensis]
MKSARVRHGRPPATGGVQVTDSSLRNAYPTPSEQRIEAPQIFKS